MKLVIGGRQMAKFTGQRQRYCHARFSSQEIAAGVKFLETFAPQTDEQKRAKVILEKFFIDGMNYSAIADCGDQRIVSFSNRGKGKPLSPTSVQKIVIDYFPNLKNVPAKKRQHPERMSLKIRRSKEKSQHVHQCAFCGSHDGLEEHHMIPLELGGTSDDRNLVFLCANCHKQVSAYQGELRKERIA